MDDLAREIEAKALQLPPKERAQLAERLISSLDPESDRDAEQAWIEEAERRLDELESGKVAGIPAEQVLEKARSTRR
jgi:putative addiction module component (TIGR02574 family)